MPWQHWHHPLCPHTPYSSMLSGSTNPSGLVCLLYLSVRCHPLNDPPYTCMIKVRLVIVVALNNEWKTWKLSFHLTDKVQYLKCTVGEVPSPSSSSTYTGHVGIGYLASQTLRNYTWSWRSRTMSIEPLSISVCPPLQDQPDNIHPRCPYSMSHVYNCYSRWLHLKFLKNLPC